MSHPTIIFIHGYTASPKADWYPAIAKELDALKISYLVPDLPGGDHPHASAWIEKIHEAVSQTDGPVIVVGHSLGTRAALLYLEKHPMKNLHALILVAAFANRIENGKRNEGKTYPDFFTHTVNVAAMQTLTPIRIVMHSQDDDSIGYDQAREIANDLHASLLTYRDRGHFSDPENYIYVLDVLQNILKV